MTRLAALPVGLAHHPIAKGMRVDSGPRREGNELRWLVTLGDERQAVVACLVEELASDTSLRRRYHRDVARVARLAPEGVAPVLAFGPGEPSEEGPNSPWRVRQVVAGESFETWLDSHAPEDPAVVATRLAALCERLGELHARGLVVRDLSPSRIVLDPEGQVWLVDIGLARTDILSTRTAASLVLEGSPYTAPEMLMRTAVDGRADLYGVGTLAFRALTGEFPFGDTHALLRPSGAAPAPSSLRPGVPPAMDALVVALLDDDPSRRPESASLVAQILRGERQTPTHDTEQVQCQYCGASMPMGQRLCLSCGRLAVQFVHADPDLPLESRTKIVLKKAKEDGDFMRGLRGTSAELCEGELPTMNFLIGDARMYSKHEQTELLRLPVTLFNDLDTDTAEAIRERYASQGVKVEVKAMERFDESDSPMAMTRRQKGWLGFTALFAALVAVFAIAEGAPALLVTVIASVLTLFVGGIAWMGIRNHNKTMYERMGRTLMSLRKQPAALPASDPLVARIAELLDEELPQDLRELLSRLALLVQRMVDHRAQHSAAAAEIDLATSALGQLVDHIARNSRAVVELDAQLAELDEGRLVRALAASQARGEDESERTALLDGLDRLRELEVERARLFASLAEACDLARRSVDMGLAVRDPALEHERQVQMALEALTRELS